MKKLLLIVIAAAAISSLPAFGQGYFLFSGSVRGFWFTGVSTNYRVAFLWGSGVPMIDALMSSTPTNGAVINATAAWNAILTDPNFHLALNNTDGSLASALVAPNGAWQYPANVAQTFPVTGTSPGAYQVYVIAWSPSWYDPAMAAVTGMPVSWSAPFSYTATSLIGTPLSFAQSGFQPFGVGIIPEPTVFSLLGLGTAALLLRRKRK